MFKRIKLLSVGIILFSAFTLIGCDETEENNEPQIVHNDGSTIKWLLARNKRIEKDVYLGELRNHDRLTLKLKGFRKTPLFSDVYSRKFPSSWLMQICFDNKYVSCGFYRRKSQCEANYRNFNGFQENTVALEEEFSKRVKVFIGPNEIPLSLFRLDFDNEVLTATLSIDESHLHDGQKLNIKKVTDENNTKLRVGFIGYGECKGRNQRDFKTSAPTGHEFKLIRDQYDFFLDAYLEYDSHE